LSNDIRRRAQRRPVKQRCGSETRFSKAARFETASENGAPIENRSTGCVVSMRHTNSTTSGVSTIG